MRTVCVYAYIVCAAVTTAFSVSVFIDRSAKDL